MHPRASEPPLSPSSRRIAGLALLSLVVSTFAWWPMLAAYPLAQGGDGPFYHKMIEAARFSVLHFHELPLWNPYECGGVPLWDNPQGVAGAPLVWPALFLGTTRTIEIWYIVHSAIGFTCMWLLARSEFRLSRGAAFVAATTWAFCGFQNQHYSGGHFTFVPFLFFPGAILLWRRAETDMRMAVGLGLLVALTIYEGGVYPLPHLVLMLGVETLMRIWPARRFVAIARAGAVVVLVAFTVGAARFLPVIDQLRSHTRPLGIETDAMQWSTLKDIFLSRDHGRSVAGQMYVWPEFGDYLGPFILVLAVIGLFLAGVENTWMIVLLVWAFLLMLGHVGRFAPWSLLKAHVFPFKEMRVPSRFVASLTMWISICAGLGIDRLAEKARRWFGAKNGSEPLRVALLGIALVGAGEMIGVGISWSAQCFTTPAEVKVEASPHLYYGGAGLAAFLDQPRQNRGRLECWEEWSFMAGAPLWNGDVTQAKSQSDGAVVEATSRTPNTFTLDIDAKQPARILINSTYDRGWRTNVGTLDNLDRELVLDVPAGRHHVELRYWPHGLTLGLWLTGLGIVAVVAFFVWDRRRRGMIHEDTKAVTEGRALGGVS